jgi:uncharacterized repeat protein (TIGR03847 family)
MAREANDFGVIDRLQASSVGLPGQRTFRLQFINEDAESAALWIEKEQMQTLGSAIESLLAQLSGSPFVDLASREGRQEAEPGAGAYFPDPPSVEFKIGKLALGYDETNQRFTLLVHDIEADQGGPPGFRCLVTREQLQQLSQQIAAVALAGRPLCPLCSTPLVAGTAHFCPPSNGHAPIQVEE